MLRSKLNIKDHHYNRKLSLVIIPNLYIFQESEIDSSIAIPNITLNLKVTVKLFAYNLQIEHDSKAVVGNLILW